MAGIKGKAGRKSRYGRPLTGTERMELSRQRVELLTENMEGLGYRRFPVFIAPEQLGALWRLEKIRERDYPPGFGFIEDGPDDQAFISRMVFLALRAYLKAEIEQLPADAPGAEELRALELPEDSFHGAAARVAAEKLLAWADQRFRLKDQATASEGGSDGLSSPA
jgi:hypothetical protein